MNEERIVGNYEGIKVQEVPFGIMENCYGEKQEYLMDILSDPKETEEKLRPVIIFVHGGGFIQPADKRQSYVSLICRECIKAGYVAVAPDYPVYNNSEERMADGSSAIYVKPPEAIKMAYDFVLANAEKYGFDTKRISLIGGSAGSISGYNALAIYKDISVTCFGALWGVTPELPDVSNFPPIFSVQGTKDMTYDRQAGVCKAFSDAHISCTLVSIGGSGHCPIDKIGEFVPPLINFLDYYNKK
ncbi:MAG: alpha/beta hydrolase [Clostridia bacterium]